MYNLLFWIGLHLLFLWFLARITAPYRDKTWFKAVFAPSAALEALVRLLGCGLSGKGVEGMYFFRNQKPFLQDGRSRVPYLGPLVFLLVWQGLAYYAFSLWATAVGACDAFAMTLPHVDPEAVSAGVLRLDFRDYVLGFLSFWRGLDTGSGHTWLFLYVVAGSFPFFAVRFRHVLLGVLLIGVVAFVTFSLGYLGFGPTFLSRGWWLRWWILPDEFRVYSLFLTLLFLTLTGHAALQLVWQGLCKMTRKSPSGRGRKTQKAAARKKREKAYA